MAEPTLGEFLAHLETLVGRIERVYGFAPCARCGCIKQEHNWIGASAEAREILGSPHAYRLAGSVAARLDTDFVNERFHV
jgi:hypothetical protein